MGYQQEWQLVAHSPDLRATSWLVALAIARRLEGEQIAISQQTLFRESRVKSIRSVERAILELRAAGLISVAARPGSRKPSLITWRLECPENCEIDHARGNAKKATRPKSDGVTRPKSDGALRSIKKRDRETEKTDPLLEPIAAALDGLETAGQASPDHLALSQALSNPSERVKIRQRAEALAINATRDPAAYLAKIAIETPLQLNPQKTANERRRNAPPPNLTPRERQLYGYETGAAS